MKKTTQLTQPSANLPSGVAQRRKSPWGYGLLGTMLVLPLVAEAQLSLPTQPLFLNGGEDPNIMLLLDSSGSMTNIVPTAPYNESEDYPSLACPSGMQLTATSEILLKVSAAGYPYFSHGGTEYDWGVTSSGTGLTGKTKRCFNPTTQYTAALVTDIGGSQRGEYTGHYLNWYFGYRKDASDTTYGFGVGALDKSGQLRRIEITKSAATTLVDGLNNVNLGLAKYNGSTGASILNLCSDIGAGTQRADIKTQIDAISASGATPLAKSLHQIGRYFVGHSGDSTTAASDTFGAISTEQYDGNLTVKTTARDDDTVFNVNPTYRSGLSPTGESPIKYSCQNNFAVLLTDGLPYSDGLSSTHPLKSYNNTDSYDLDDVAKALYEIDLRPDVKGKTNLTTYAIGLADPVLLADPLLKTTAAVGGGEAYTAKDAADLKAAFDAAFNAIQAKKGSGTAVSFSKTADKTSTTKMFASKFDTEKWSGNVRAFNLGETITPSWDAAALLDAPADADLNRQIITYDPVTSKDGIPFQWTNLSTPQKNDLLTNPDGSLSASTADGQARLAYLRGTTANEGTTLRERDSRLGDIVNSAPIYAGIPEINWALPGYASFKSSKAGRTGVVYVGANDGMLHAFNASTGAEMFAYIPSNLFSTDAKAGLHYLTDRTYNHRFYVDLTPSISDAVLGTEWKTILVGGQGAGGRGLFALDINDPSSFSEAKAADIVLWEFTNAHDSELGYTYSRPVVVKTNNQGRWAVVVGNGYNSNSNEAYLFIIFLDANHKDGWQEGTDYIKIKAPAAGAGPSAPNGLASPAVIDTNGDSIYDRVYAGDLLGNLWAFDISEKDNPSNWKVRHGSNPLYKSSASTPITTAPQIITLDCKKYGVCDKHKLVIFGTGRHLTESDKASTDVQSLIGVIDRESDTTGDITIDKLVQQTITTRTDDLGNQVRLLTANPVDWSSAKGWYFNLPVSGERIIYNPKIRGDVVLFNTMYPVTGTCLDGSDGWLMAVDWAMGDRPDEAVFDRNGDEIVDEDDGITLSDGTNAHISGIKRGDRDFKCDGDYCYGFSKDGEVDLANLRKEKIQDIGGLAKKRISWQELLQ
ncbi:MAG: PilC/PilY family type IV pilus protein [Pseudomonadota bacterium]